MYTLPNIMKTIEQMLDELDELDPYYKPIYRSLEKPKIDPRCIIWTTTTNHQQTKATYE